MLALHFNEGVNRMVKMREQSALEFCLPDHEQVNKRVTYMELHVLKNNAVSATPGWGQAMLPRDARVGHIQSHFVPTWHNILLVLIGAGSSHNVFPCHWVRISRRKSKGPLLPLFVTCSSIDRSLLRRYEHPSTDRHRFFCMFVSIRAKKQKSTVVFGTFCNMHIDRSAVRCTSDPSFCESLVMKFAG